MRLRANPWCATLSNVRAPGLVVSHTGLMDRRSRTSGCQSRRDCLSIERTQWQCFSSVGATCALASGRNEVTPTELKNPRTRPFYQQEIPTGLAGEVFLLYIKANVTDYQAL